MTADAHAHRNVFGTNDDGTEVAQFRLRHGSLSVDISKYFGTTIRVSYKN
jgi:hypothetical protein